MDATQATVSSGPSTPMTNYVAPKGPIAPPKIPDVELESEIGRGGMGVVYRGRQPYLDRRVAVKLLLLEQGPGSQDYVKRFQREAKILAGLSHPHIVGCYSAGVTTDANPYLVMEFIDGPNLRDWVKEQGPLPAAQAVAAVREVARALEHANANGIIHRDVKPENVLLAKREQARPGEFPWTTKLVDLGLARPQAKDAAGGEGMHLTMQGVLMGTPSTMAPEQFDDPEHVDFRADIYGLGCVLYQALTGAPAFASRTLGEIVSAKISGSVPNPQDRVASLPRGVCELVTWMLARDRGQRPQSYQALIARCDELSADPNRSRPRPRSRAPLVVGALAVVLAAGVAVAALMRGKPESQPPAPVAAVPATAAGASTPSTAPNAVPAFGEPSTLLAAHGGLLDGWAPHADGQWALSEEREGAVSGSRGAFVHPLEAKPLRLEAKLYPGSSEILSLGVAVGDLVTMASIKNFGRAYLAETDTGTRDDPVALLQGAPQTVVVTKEIAVVVTVVDKVFTAEIGGVALKPLQLSGPATDVVLYVKAAGESPAEVGHLTVRYAP